MPRLDISFGEGLVSEESLLLNELHTSKAAATQQASHVMHVEGMWPLQVRVLKSLLIKQGSSCSSSSLHSPSFASAAATWSSRGKSAAPGLDAKMPRTFLQRHVYILPHLKTYLFINKKLLPNSYIWKNKKSC